MFLKLSKSFNSKLFALPDISKVDPDTFFALGTRMGPGTAPIDIIRISGPFSHSIVSQLSSRPIPKPNNLIHTTLSFDQKIIDSCSLCIYSKPKSYTGQDMAEIFLHGNPIVVQEMVQVLSKFCRPAFPGEFTRQAFQNGKMTLPQVQGLSDLLASETPAQKDLALSQLLGSFSNLLQDWKDQLVHILASVEAYLDFDEDDDLDIGTSHFSSLRKDVESLCSKIQSTIERDGQIGLLIRNTFHVTLIGSPNTGKSSLKNCILNREDVLVSPIPGTTRDAISSRIDINGLPITLTDTAGIREISNSSIIGSGSNHDDLERLGIEKTRLKISNSNLLLYVFDINNMPLSEFSSFPNNETKSNLAVKLEPEMDGSFCSRDSKDIDTCIIFNKIDLLSSSHLDTLETHIFNNSTTFGHLPPLWQKKLLLEQTEFYNPNDSETKPREFNSNTTVLFSSAASHSYSDNANVSKIDKKLNTRSNLLEYLSLVTKNIVSDPGSLVITRERQLFVLLSIVDNLESFLSLTKNDSTIALDVACEHLRYSVQHHFGELLGKTSNEDVLDIIFKEFCIGK